MKKGDMFLLVLVPLVLLRLRIRKDLTKVRTVSLTHSTFDSDYCSCFEFILEIPFTFNIPSLIGCDDIPLTALIKFLGMFEYR